MLMSHFICQTVRNTSFRLYSRPSSVTNGKQLDRNHPFSLLQCRQVGGVGDVVETLTRVVLCIVFVTMLADMVDDSSTRI